MRALLTFGSLLVVLAVIAVSVRSQLSASKHLLPAAASGAASDALTGSPQNQVTQYQRQLDAAMKAAAQHTDAEAASAGEDGTR